MITVVAPSRIHLGLMQLSAAYSFKDIGIGFAVESPNWRLQASLANTVRVLGVSSRELKAALVKTLIAAASEYGIRGVHVTVQATIPPHVGLGSKTALTCAGLAVCAALVDDRDWSKRRHLTGRGGTSGVGINTAVTGGMVFDVGHVLNRGEYAFTPSSSAKAAKVPAVAARWECARWELALVRPLRAKRFSGATERRIFDLNLPLSKCQVDEAAGVVMYDLIPSLTVGDYDLFAAALGRLQLVGFKKVEWQAQDRIVREIRDMLFAAGAKCVALSSMGPTMAVFARDVDSLIHKFRNCDGLSVMKTRVAQTGIRVINAG